MSQYLLHDTFAGHKHAADFSAVDGHLGIDISLDESSTQEFPARELRHDELDTWASTEPPGSTTPGYRILITAPIKSTAPGRRRYPLSLEAMDDIIRCFCLPKPFVNFVAAHTTVALDFEVPEPVNNANHGGLGTETKSKGIITVLGPLSLGMSYSATTPSLSAILIGLCDHQALKLIKSLRDTPQLLTTPMLLPILWLNLLGETRAHPVIGRRDALYRIDIELGYHWAVQHPARRLQNIDFDVATRKLTVYGSKVSWDVHAIEAQIEILALVEEVHQQLSGARKDSGDAGQLRMRARHIRQVLSGLMHWTKKTQSRVQIQLQTVYSLISQHDNDLSYDTAVASQRIAEITQRDSAIMKELAAQSKALAVRTWRDGVDMRVMAVITLLTLPGTFTATLFSTSFFDFQPAQSGQFVSPWLWLYVAVTVCFTALCLSGWYLTSRSMSQRAEVAMYLPKEADDNSNEPPLEAQSQCKPESRLGQDIRLDPIEGHDAAGTTVESRKRPQQSSQMGMGTSTGFAASLDTQKILSDGLAPEREYWDVSSIWGTQSYGLGGKACAMCAEHLD